jgi:hypothetical protein
MRIKYKHSYLSNGEKIKITYELSDQLKAWESQGDKIDREYLDIIKIQDDDWLNSLRQYYRYNASVSANHQNISSHPNSDKEAIRAQEKSYIDAILDVCTETQRRRFIKHYYLDYSYSRIAKQENCSKRAVGISIKTLEKRIINKKYLF